jgi:hypothetical protein
MKLKTALIAWLFLALSLTASFANEVTLVANDQMIENDNMIILRDGVLYASASELGSHFGSEVRWLDVAKLAVLNIDTHYYSFGINTAEAYMDQSDLALSQPTLMEDNLLYVPLDDLVAWYGAAIVWMPEALTLYLDADAFQYDTSEIKTLTYTDEDLLWLARIVDVETGDATIFKRMAVANVVMNRVKSERFPNTIYEVIFQSGQFPPSKRDGFTTLVPKMTSVIAAKRALEGENNIDTCLFFNNRPFSGKSDDFYQLIEGDYFYY